MRTPKAKKRKSIAARDYSGGLEVGDSRAKCEIKEWNEEQNEREGKEWHSRVEEYRKNWEKGSHSRGFYCHINIMMKIMDLWRCSRACLARRTPPCVTSDPIK